MEIKAKYLPTSDGLRLTTEEYDQLMAMIQKNNDVKALKEIKQGKRAPKAPTWPRNGDLDHLVKAQWVGIWERKQSKQGKRTLSHTAGCESHKRSLGLGRRDPKHLRVLHQPEAKQSSTDPLDPHPSTAPECLSNPIILQESDDLVNHNRVGGTFRRLTIQDELNFDSWWSSFYSGETEMAINVNGDEIGTLVNVNEKNPEDDDQIPRRGMAFSSELEAEEFCKKYAKRIGFTVRKGKVQRKANGTLKGRCFLCSCEGFRTKKHPNQGTKYQRSETRTGCNVQIQVKLDNGQWVITKLHLEHNHRLQCLDTLNWPSDEVEGASGADKVCQNFQLKLPKYFSLGTFTSKLIFFVG
uniref:FAR1 domain-containing protein n=1 Tax=Vitis vinifera TaxID=29760 RepID=F6HN47_VITVI